MLLRRVVVLFTTVLLALGSLILPPASMQAAVPCSSVSSLSLGSSTTGNAPACYVIPVPAVNTGLLLNVQVQTGTLSVYAAGDPGESLDNLLAANISGEQTLMVSPAFYTVPTIGFDAAGQPSSFTAVPALADAPPPACETGPSGGGPPRDVSASAYDAGDLRIAQAAPTPSILLPIKKFPVLPGVTPGTTSCVSHSNVIPGGALPSQPQEQPTLGTTAGSALSIPFKTASNDTLKAVVIWHSPTPSTVRVELDGPPQLSTRVSTADTSTPAGDSTTGTVSLSYTPTAADPKTGWWHWRIINSSGGDVSAGFTLSFTAARLTPSTLLFADLLRKHPDLIKPVTSVQPAEVVSRLPPDVHTGPSAPATAPALAHDAQYYAQTGYRIDDDLASFFQSRGGLETFGYPVSRTFSFLGCRVQMFQRQILQLCPGQSPALLNMLDPEIFPYTRVNGSVFPGPDEQIKAATPAVNTPAYDRILDYVTSVAPDTFEGRPVGFFTLFSTHGGLEIWGAPISRPAADPNNSGFVYQRFQRGVMHYRAGVGTDGILLADYLKAILLDNSTLPSDLKAQAAGSPYLRQYCPGGERWLCRPDVLPSSDLTFAFERG